MIYARRRVYVYNVDDAREYNNTAVGSYLYANGFKCKTGARVRGEKGLLPHLWVLNFSFSPREYERFVTFRTAKKKNLHFRVTVHRRGSFSENSITVRGHETYHMFVVRYEYGTIRRDESELEK